MNNAYTVFDQIETLGYRGVAIFGPDEQAAGDGAGKRPCSGAGWQNHAPETHRACLTSTSGRNVAILCAHGSDNTAIDIDCVYPNVAAVLETLPVLAWLPRRYGNKPRVLFPCKIKNVSDEGTVHDLTFRHSDGREFTIQIIRGQYVAWGTHPKTRKPYEWVGNLPPSADLPYIDYAQFVRQTVEAMGTLGFTTKNDRPGAFAPLPGDLTDEEKRALIETGERIARGKAKRIDNGSDRRDTHVFAAASYWRALIDADVVTEDKAREIIEDHLAAAAPHYQAQVDQGLRKGNDTAFKELCARRAFVAAAGMGFTTGQAGLGPEFGQGQLGTHVAPAASADGALEVPPLPDFAECPALAEVAMLAPSYGVDPAVATGMCIGAAGNMLAAKFDVVGVNGGKPLGTNITIIGFQKSGAGKSTAIDSLLNGAKAALTAKAAMAQLSQALFVARYSAYAKACANQNAAPLPMNVLKPVRVEGDDFTPQSLQRVLFANAPPVLISTDEASTMFELATTQDLRVALANTLISVVGGTVKKSTRISDARAMGTTVGKASTAAIETEANATSRVSIVGLTQDDNWRKWVLGRGMLEYMETRGVMARMLLIPANTKLRMSERMRSTTTPGEGKNSPFKLWEETATALAKGIEMHIDRTSLYGKQVGEEQTLAPAAPLALWVTGLPAMPSIITPPAPAPEDFNSAGTRALGAIDASDAPKVPRGIMLGGDTMRRIVLSISDSDRAAMKERCAVFMEHAERGTLGALNAALEALVARIPDKIMQVAAALHGLNKADDMIALPWSPFTPDDQELFIPAATLDRKRCCGPTLH
jgi:hypothetical protein